MQTFVVFKRKSQKPLIRFRVFACRSVKKLSRKPSSVIYYYNSPLAHLQTFLSFYLAVIQLAVNIFSKSNIVPYILNDKKEIIISRSFFVYLFLPQWQVSLSTLRFITLFHNDPAAHQDHCGRYRIRIRNLCLRSLVRYQPHFQF